MPIQINEDGINCNGLRMFHGSMLGQVRSPGSCWISLRASKLFYSSKFSPYHLTLRQLWPAFMGQKAKRISASSSSDPSVYFYMETCSSVETVDEVGVQLGVQLHRGS